MLLEHIYSPLYTVPDMHDHNIKLSSFRMSVAFKFLIIFHNIITTNHRESGKSKCDPNSMLLPHGSSIM